MKPPILATIILLIVIYTFYPTKLVRDGFTAPRSDTVTISDGAFLKPNVYPVTIKPIVLGSLMSFDSRTITAYSSTIDQTDSTPFVTASGQRVRKGIIASNDFPFGTMVEIEGLGIFEIQDRMNSRYIDGEMDIWFDTKEEAIIFGKQSLVVYIYNR